MKLTTTLALLLAGVTLLFSCRSQPTREHHEEGKEPESSHPEQVTEAPIVPLEGLRGVRWIAAPEPHAEGAWFPGEAIGDESAQAVLSSPVSGQVVSPPFSPGRTVRSGAALLTINSPQQAELYSRWLVAKADVERAEATLAREDQLLAGGATSQQEVDRPEHPVMRSLPLGRQGHDV